MSPLNPLLKVEVESDLANLERVVSKIRELRKEIGTSEPSFRNKAAFGALLHSFYNGVENILKRIAEEVDQGVPMGGSWHRVLLRRMEKEIGGIRPAVLHHDTVKTLEPYLATSSDIRIPLR